MENKYFDRIRDELRKSCIASSDLTDRARDLFGYYAAVESSRCPVDGDWLRERGLKPGPQFSHLLRTLNEEWTRNLHQDKAAFLARAQELLVDSQPSEAVHPATQPTSRFFLLKHKLSWLKKTASWAISLARRPTDSSG